MLGKVTLHPIQAASLKFVKEDSRFSTMHIRNGIVHYKTLETYLYNQIDLDNITNIIRQTRPNIDAVVIDGRLTYLAHGKSYDEVAEVTSNIIKDNKESMLTKLTKSMAKLVG